MKQWHIGTIASLVGVASCSGDLARVPTYRYVGIDLSGSIEGNLSIQGNCIRVQSGSESFVPVWPEGIVVEPTGVRLPEANGGQLVRFGRRIVMLGGRNPSSGGISNYGSVAKCGDSAFLVNTAREL